VSGSVASDAPFIGCIRDVLVKSPSVVTDFNAAPYFTGVKLGTCITSAAKSNVFCLFASRKHMLKKTGKLTKNAKNAKNWWKIGSTLKKIGHN
jgi:hypothetical protein